MFRANNFIKFVTDHKEIKEDLNNQSEANISANKLPQDFLELIGDSWTDVYPWDYSIIAGFGSTLL